MHIDPAELPPVSWRPKPQALARWFVVILMLGFGAGLLYALLTEGESALADLGWSGLAFLATLIVGSFVLGVYTAVRPNLAETVVIDTPPLALDVTGIAFSIDRGRRTQSIVTLASSLMLLGLAVTGTLYLHDRMPPEGAWEVGRSVLSGAVFAVLIGLGLLSWWPIRQLPNAPRQLVLTPTRVGIVQGEPLAMVAWSDVQGIVFTGFKRMPVIDLHLRDGAHLITAYPKAHKAWRRLAFLNGIGSGAIQVVPPQFATKAEVATYCVNHYWRHPADRDELAGGHARDRIEALVAMVEADPEHRWYRPRSLGSS